jgi:peptidoglycan/xylan/chitin deacetylase (PgdA/CDA1 family)
MTWHNVKLALCCCVVLLVGLAVLFGSFRHLEHRKQQSPSQPTVAVQSTHEFAVPVLMYHRIDDLSEDESKSPLLCDLTVAPKDFNEQIKYLVDNGFSILSAKDVERAVRERRALPERAVALTMDDGYRDNFERAFPILRKYGVPATIFLVTSAIDGPKHLTWEQATQMQRHQVGYGSHTVHHFDLTTLTQPTLDYELVESKRVIESRIGERITSIAYPSGEYNDEVVNRTEFAGYLAGWKKGGGPVQPDDNAFLLPRIRIRGCTTMDDFKRKVWSGVNTIKINRARPRSEM